MRISSDRRYHFDVGTAVVWDAITDVRRFREWWPWLRRFDAEGLSSGEVWDCTVQPPLPYSLSFRITLDEVEVGRRIDASVSGEISGNASVELTPVDDDRCTVRLTSHLAPASRLLQSVALMARPVVALGHDWVLDNGARQFRRHLSSPR